MLHDSVAKFSHHYSGRGGGAVDPSRRGKNGPALRLRFRFALAAVVAPLALSSGIAQAACEEQVQSQIRALGVRPFEVGKVTVTAERGSELPLQGYKGWVSLQFCRGYLVIDMDDRCSPRDEYTTRDCEVPGVPRY